MPRWSASPTTAKIELLDYLVDHGKHALVEKPLLADDAAVLGRLEQNARTSGVVLYTAYNHRFEPHFVRMRDLIASGTLGSIYRCRMFYGNGTARLVRNSDWRDQGAGVLADLGSHVLDTAASGSATSAPNFRSSQPIGSRTAVRITSCSPRARAPAARVRNDDAELAQSFHLRCLGRERQRAYQFAVQVGSGEIHPPRARAAERPAAGSAQ